MCYCVSKVLHNFNSFVPFRLETLREAIANHQDLEFIRALFEDGKVPNEVRADLWKVREQTK